MTSSPFTPGTRVRIVRADDWTAFIGETGTITARFTPGRNEQGADWDWYVRIDDGPAARKAAGDVPFYEAELEVLS